MIMSSKTALLAVNCLIGNAEMLRSSDEVQSQDFSTAGTALLQRGMSQPDFSKYMTAFGRSYQHGTEEYEERRAVFKRNVLRIQAQNSLPERTWSAGLNHFADRTDEELQQLLGWRRTGKRMKGMVMLHERAQVVSTVPDTVDWTHLKTASDVPDQDKCGSCWAFSTTSMLQARYEISRNETRTFSAQQLVNCVPNPQECGGSGGCEGATVELAMDYVQKMGLKDTDAEPYSGVDSECSTPVLLEATGSKRPSFLNTRSRDGSDFGLQTWQTLTMNKLLPLMNAVADGPVAISVAADTWFNYISGIFDGCGENGIINHAVVLFGYGQDSSTGTKFWSIRNSWGSSWGEKGFIRLLRRDDAEEEAYCGIDVDPGAGTACKPYPKTARICGMCGLLYDSVAASFISV